MTVSDTTASGQTDAISFDIELQHSPAKVWRALTEPELMKEWLLPVLGFKLEAGAQFMFKTQAYPGWDGTVSCQLLEVEPPHKISYTWTVPFLSTIVTFTLTPQGAGTRLQIVQTGFSAQQKSEFGGARYGWKMMSERLVELLGRTP